LVGVNPVVGVISVFCVAVSVGVPPDIAGAAGSNTVMLITEVAVRAGLEESVAVTVNTVLANVVAGVPVILPVVPENVSPVGSIAPPAPEIVYAIVPVNPVGVNSEVSVIALPFVAFRFCVVGESEAAAAAETTTGPTTVDPALFTFAEFVAITSTK
jgi:hypothetical protein